MYPTIWLSLEKKQHQHIKWQKVYTSLVSMISSSLCAGVLRMKVNIGLRAVSYCLNTYSIVLETLKAFSENKEKNSLLS